MSRCKWWSSSHHPASEWVSFGRYRMRMVHGMDHILHKLFLFLTTQSSGQKNENKVPGCAQLWLLPPWGHSRALGDRHSMNLRIFVVPCYISMSFKKKYAICFIWRQTVLLVSDKLVRNRCTMNQPPSLLTFFLWETMIEHLHLACKIYKNQCVDVFHHDLCWQCKFLWFC